MAEESLKHKAVKGTMWSALERFSIQGVQFVVMLIMARLLTPADYGLVGMLTVFLAVANCLIDGGFGNALVRKQARSQLDCSTVFYFNLGMSIVLYIVLYVSAPYIAEFYDEPQLIAIARVIGVTLIINAFGAIQGVLKSAELDFKIIAKVSIVNAVFTGCVGIYLAWQGYGVWSLVYSTLVGAFSSAILSWIVFRWRPSFLFSLCSFKEFFGYGFKLAISGLLDTMYKNIYQVVIGKVYSATDLGYYTRAYNFSTFPSSNITSVISRVTFPLLCKIKDDDIRLEVVYRKILRLSAYIIFPLMVGLAIVAHPMIVVLIGEKWSFSATLLSIICLYMMWYPVHAINLSLLQVKGRSDLFLRLEIIKKVNSIIMLCVTVPIGIVAMCWGGIYTSIVALIINTYYTGKLINVGFLKQMWDLIPTILYCGIMAIVVLVVIAYVPANAMKLLVGIPIGVLTYLGISKITKSPELSELMLLIKRRNG